MEENFTAIQNVIIENRNRLNVSGIKEVLSFDDETLLLDTTQGKMTVKGENLKIESFNTENGELSAEGKIHAVVYMTDVKTSGGILSKIFK